MKKLLFILMLSSLFVACTEGDKEVRCGDVVCKTDETCVANVCQKKDVEIKCGAIVCKTDETCVADVCQKKDVEIKCGAIVCKTDETCVANVCQKKDVEIKCGAIVCKTDETCVADVCEKKVIDEKCGDVVCKTDELCVNKLCQTKCGDGVCSADQACVENACRPQDVPRKCRDRICKDSEICINGICTARISNVKLDDPCNAKTFLEFCKDENTYVSCQSDTSKIAIGECNPLSKCIMQAQYNYSGCSKPDHICKRAGQKFDRCNAPASAGAASYMTYHVCEYGMDDKLYPFYTDQEDIDCLSGCFDDYSCNKTTEVCSDKDYQVKCEADVYYYCAEKRVFRMSCKELGLTCGIVDGEPNCQ